MPGENKGDAAEIGKRASHYGDGRQPWDDILEQGWGPAFAAGNALKYIRRYKTKNGEDDIKKARWYFAELCKGVEADGSKDTAGPKPWIPSFGRLLNLLTPEEKKLLDPEGRVF